MAESSDEELLRAIPATFDVGEQEENPIGIEYHVLQLESAKWREILHESTTPEGEKSD